MKPSRRPRQQHVAWREAPSGHKKCRSRNPELFSMRDLLFACLLELLLLGRNGNMKPRKPTHYPVDFVVSSGKSKILRFSARSYSSKAGSFTCALRAYARWTAAELCPKAA